MLYAQDQLSQWPILKIKYIEKYFKELAIAEDYEDMDEEEEGDATTSRTRSEKKERTFSIPLNSVKVLDRRRATIEKFLTNYAIGLNKLFLKNSSSPQQTQPFPKG